MSDPLHVLFLFTSNSCRSQMADGIVNNDFSGRVKAVSAGTEPQGLNPRAVQVMDEIGIDISRNSSDHLSRYQDMRFDYVISLCGDADAQCPASFGGIRRLHMPFDDPLRATGSEEQVLAVYRRVRDEIRTQMNAFFNQKLKGR